MKRGFTLVELLVALAILGLVSALALSSLLSLFGVNRKTALEAQATLVAKDFFERAVRESTYTSSGGSYVLSVPAPTQRAGFAFRLRAGGRMGPNGSLTLTPCAQSGNRLLCSVACGGGACRFVALELTLEGGGRTYAFYREWQP